MRDREAFLNRSMVSLEWMLKRVERLSDLPLADLDPAKTALVIVDMVKGFTSEGPLSSPRVGGLAAEIARLHAATVALGIPVVAFGDSHPGDSVEFTAYPPHCVAGTSESEIIDELRAIGGYTWIPKNSTNGFLEPAFQTFLAEHPDLTTFLVVGDCTDICILQFTTSLKAHFNRLNRTSRVVVPVNCVETFDADFHDGDLMHLFALQSMAGNAIELVSRIS